MLDLSIVIVTYNSASDIVECIDSLERTKGETELEIIVVDNASSDCTVDLVRSQYHQVHLIANDHNVGFSRANNQAIALANGRFVMLLNPDTIVHPDALHRMVEFMDANPSVAVCAPRLLDTQGAEAPDLRKPSLWLYFIQSVGLGTLVRSTLPASKVDVVSGACFLIRATIIPTVGVLDPDLFWFEDVDYCLRVTKRGMLIRIVPDTFVTHIVGQSAKSNLGLMLEKQYTSKLLYYRKNRPRLESFVLLVLFELQIVLRLIRWCPVRILRHSEESVIRIGTFSKLLLKLPLLVLNQRGLEVG